MAFIPFVMIMVIIFDFSNGDGEESVSLSYTVAEYVSAVLENIGITLTPEKIHLPIRKIAHFSEYACLSITGMWAFYDIRKRSAIVGIWSIIYACIDEVHQSFVPGRCASFVDVLIDSSGAVTGLLVYLMILKIYCVKRNRDFIV